jgi:hypothetical protein
MPLPRKQSILATELEASKSAPVGKFGVSFAAVISETALFEYPVQRGLTRCLLKGAIR